MELQTIGSLITWRWRGGGGGGLQNWRRGWASEVLPLQKGGREDKVLAMLKGEGGGGGGGTKSFE